MKYREADIYQIEYLLKKDFIMYLEDNNIVSVNDENIISIHKDFEGIIKDISIEILKENNPVCDNSGTVINSYYKFSGFSIGIEYYNNNWIDGLSNMRSQSIVKFIDELIYGYYDKLYNIIDDDAEISIKSYFNKQEIAFNDSLSDTTSSEIKYDVRLTDISKAPTRLKSRGF